MKDVTLNQREQARLQVLNSKPMPVVRAVQIRLTHIWPPGCKLTASRVVWTKADQRLVLICPGNSMARKSCDCIIGDAPQGDPVREIVNRGDFLRRCGYSPTQR